MLIRFLSSLIKIYDILRGLFFENCEVNSLKPQKNVTKNGNNVHIDINMGN